MTNKINGIDVSECDFYEEIRELPDNLNGGYYIQHCYCGLQGDNYCICNKNPDCYFKQLKRSQEENEKLKNKNNDLIEEIASGNIDIDILQEENEKLKKLKKYYKGFVANCKFCDEWYMDKCNYIKKDNKYKQALEKIINIAEKLITETPEYNSCYYKDKCGDNCTPKKQNKVEYCCYENVDKILTIINEALNEQK